jgi:hypothetical protein
LYIQTYEIFKANVRQGTARQEAKSAPVQHYFYMTLSYICRQLLSLQLMSSKLAMMMTTRQPQNLEGNSVGLSLSGKHPKPNEARTTRPSGNLRADIARESLEIFSLVHFFNHFLVQ